MDKFSKYMIVSLTKNGTDLNLKISKSLDATGFTLKKYQIEGLKSFSNIHDIIELAFKQYQGLIFIGACGIIVRCIVPYVKSKLTDIPIVVCDELGKYAIPILSGHLGGANQLANQVAKITGGLAIITTATDINNKFSVDIWAKENNLVILEPYKIKDISSAILDNVPIGFYSEYPIEKPKSLTSSKRIGIVVSNRTDITPFENTLHLLPKNIVVGVGCKKNTPLINIETIVFKVFKDLNFDIKSIKKICSIDLKSNEIGLLSFCDKYNLKIEFYSNKELNSICGDFSKSKFVENITGVDCVCERSAMFGCNQGKIVQKKISLNGVTIAIALDTITTLQKKG